MLQLLYLPALAVAVVLLHEFATAIYNVFFHPLRRYPGPLLSKASRMPWSYHIFHGNLSRHIANLHEKYGDVVRIAPDELSYINSQAWAEIYGHRQANGTGNLPKERRSRRAEANGVASITSANEEDHRRMRRLQSHAFSEKALSAQEPLITSYVDKLISRLHEQSRKAEPVVDIVKWYNYTTFDVLGDLAFGDSFGCLDSDTLHPWIINIFQSIKDTTFFRASLEFPWPLNKYVYSLRPKGLEEAHKAEFSFAANRARERMLQGGTDKVDFMSYILKHNDEKGMTPAEIESNSSVLIIAGSETTATFLSGITYNLVTNPTILAKLTTLIRTTFPTDQDINVLQLGQLEYFTCCLEEGLRTYPPVPSGSPRSTTSDGSVICGQYVPAGTTVSVPQFACYLSSKNFADPDKFVPDRWLKNPPARYKDDDKRALQPFSTGPRNCMGRNLAYAEMRLILAKMLWNFDLELQPGSQNWLDQKVYALWEKGPLYVKITPRKF